MDKGSTGKPGRGYGRIVRADDPRLDYEKWTPDKIIEALHDYEKLYGNSTAASFSISSAKWQGRPELRERYLAGNPLQDGARWPSLNTIKKRFGGSFDEARRAAGLEPNRPGPVNGRRPPGSAEPIRDVRDRLVVLPSERSVVALKRIEAKDREIKRLRARVERLESALEASRAAHRRSGEINTQLRAKLVATRAEAKELREAATSMVEELTA